MPALTAETCDACKSDAPRLDQNQTDSLLPQVPGWQVVEEEGEPRLRRLFKVKDFAAALALTNEVGKIAEAADHHPAILTEYGKVTVSWWTHKIKGLHRNDFIMAAKTSDLAGHD